VGEPGQPHAKRVKGVLLLEAEAASKRNQQLEGWEAATLAQSSRRLVTDFVARLKPSKLHLFLATPLGLAVFLGYHWNNIRKAVQCYEETWDEQGYTPSCALRLD
jgi:hypothetical protein